MLLQLHQALVFGSSKQLGGDDPVDVGHFDGQRARCQRRTDEYFGCRVAGFSACVSATGAAE